MKVAILQALMVATPVLLLAGYSYVVECLDRVTPVRFRIRGLFIATTVIAMALGLIIYAVR
jgi:hypothetical protein